MNAQEKQITFQELRQVANELRAKAAADPLQRAVTLLDAAVKTLDKCDTLVEQGQFLEKQNAKLKNEVSVLEERKEKLAQENQALENQITSLREKAEHWKRAERDAMTKRMVDAHL